MCVDDVEINSYERLDLLVQTRVLASLVVHTILIQIQARVLAHISRIKLYYSSYYLGLIIIVRLMNNIFYT